ncbi:alanine racemase [Rubrivivax gelatinosus]|uniref:alanine racemase n=1 Tax=Rubrivivax gelatinosus TaxID=28068 RepID=UPI0019071FC7|nr:alanine racemase [Rubrivivax gelatinosus]MBK1616273.1 alanine racemase [Rubrivivax gelatinosus]
MTLDLAALLAAPLEATTKGLPARAVGRPLAELGTLGLRLDGGELPWPVALLKDSALAHNSAWMRDFCARAGVSLCPHGKTTMAPQLFERQLADGAWGITAATAGHVRTYRRFGVPRVLLANQLVGAANVDLVLAELEADPAFDFYTLVDSEAALAELLAGLARRPIARPLQVLLELGAPGARTGVRGREAALALGRAIRAAAPAIALRGIEAYEGVVPGDGEAAVELAALTLIEQIGDIAAAGVAEAWFAPGEVIVSAGGSQFFDLAAQVLAAVAVRPDGPAVRPLLRSGCYLSHDALHYERMQARLRQRAGAAWGRGPGLRNALEVWTVVQSVPEPGRAICAAGKRDLSHDLMLPQPLGWWPAGEAAPRAAPSGIKTVALSDQHAWVDAADGAMPWRVGDLVGFGVGHPCTTFDRWGLLYTVDDGYRVTGGVRTFF